MRFKRASMAYSLNVYWSLSDMWPMCVNTGKINVSEKLKNQKTKTKIEAKI